MLPRGSSGRTLIGLSLMGVAINKKGLAWSRVSKDFACYSIKKDRYFVPFAAFSSALYSNRSLRQKQRANETQSLAY
uniref:Uncharacterized protein n=1 Tax=Utricularia reniformis TaxID=192314 RepID=A0A1Y0B0C8_9LAMI|nr:hypothetical protein AEK19_MT0620 [Utricularia reniformis]ART30875.1 hypothetical protein AEK19_MT0620 [Utricularia reniformis]